MNIFDFETHERLIDLKQAAGRGCADHAKRGWVAEKMAMCEKIGEL
ncbi:hypothetical protein [Chromobacterium paludis]|nr:hypothetical protein [Chromobacterium paludis]